MKSILITGASSGIGKAVALRFLQAGWCVGLVARRVDKIREMEKAHSGAIALSCDVSIETQVHETFAAFRQRVGKLDVLFNNAGVFTPAAPIDEVSLEDWNRAVAVNLTGMFLCAREAFAQMRHQSPTGGRIINNGSISAHVPREGAVAYTVTKHGVTGLTRQLALDGRNFDIACGQIDIGNAMTDLLKLAVEEAHKEGQPAPPSMDVGIVADAVLQMAELPLTANVLFQTIMATKMPYVGRG